MKKLKTILGLLVLAPGMASAGSSPVPLRLVADIPMPGKAVRFDYQSFDPTSGRLYVAHMNADQLVVFDTRPAGRGEPRRICARSWGVGGSGARTGLCLGHR